MNEDPFFQKEILMGTAVNANLQDALAQAAKAKAEVEAATEKKQKAVQSLIAATAADDEATVALAAAIHQQHVVCRSARAVGFTMLESLMPAAGNGPAKTPVK